MTRARSFTINRYHAPYTNINVLELGRMSAKANQVSGLAVVGYNCVLYDDTCPWLRTCPRPYANCYEMICKCCVIVMLYLMN